jgi:hypothetical protein
VLKNGVCHEQILMNHTVCTIRTRGGAMGHYVAAKEATAIGLNQYATATQLPIKIDFSSKIKEP